MEPILRTVTDNSWIFAIVLSVILLLGVTKLIFYKYYATLGDLNLFLDNQEKLVPMIVVIHVLLACVIGLILYPFIDLNLNINEWSDLITGSLLIGAVLAYFILRLLINAILVLLLGINEHYKSIVKVKLYYRVFALFGLLISCLFLFFSPYDQNIILYVALAIMAITLLLEYVYQFRKNGLQHLYVSYYFILYLCILEILPVLFVINHWNR